RFRDLALSPSAALPAPPTASIACQCDWDHANREEYAERQHHPQPIGVHRCLLVSINAARAELMREAREIRRRTRKVGKPTQKPRTTSRVTFRNAINCKKFLAGVGPFERISCWNHQIFCVNWRCFISPQGSHALCNGKILGQPDGRSSRRTHGDVSVSCGGRVLFNPARALPAFPPH